MRGNRLWTSLPAVLAAALCLNVALAQPLGQPRDIQTMTLDNGMEFLLVPDARWPGKFAAGWMARGGSSSDPEAHPGLTQFVEVMLFAPTADSLPGAPEPAEDQIDSVRNTWRQLHELHDMVFWHVQYGRWRRGEIHDPWHATTRTEEMRSLKEAIDQFELGNRNLLRRGGYGGYHSDIDGYVIHHGTTQDFTVAYMAAPRAKLESWFSTEAERLAGRPFDRFEDRFSVVQAGRIKRDTGPVFAALQQFEHDYWVAGPYGHTIVGSVHDHARYSESVAREHLRRQFQPRNLVGVVVGDFSLQQATELAQEHFGRLENDEAMAPFEPGPAATSPGRAFAYTWPEPDHIELRHPSVSWEHNDRVGLEMLAWVLGQRLNKALVRGDGPRAASVQVGQDSLAHAGAFVFTAEAAEGTGLDALHRAWNEAVQALIEDSISEVEWRAAVRQARLSARWVATGPETILCELISAEGRGGWAWRAEQEDRVRQVKPEDLPRLARQYLEAENQVVAWFRSFTVALRDVPELSGLTEPELQQLAAMLSRLLERENADELRLVRTQLHAQMPGVDERNALMLGYVIKRLDARIAELTGEGDG